MAFQVPNQKLTRSEKIELHGSEKEWGISVFKAIQSLSNYGSLSRNYYLFDVQANYELAEGRLNHEDFNYVTRPYQTNSRNFKFPAEFRHYDILTPKLEVLRGEEMKRPFNFKAVAINPEVINDVLEEKKKAVHDYIDKKLQDMMAKAGMIEPEIDPETGEPVQPPIPEHINRYYEYEYKHVLEKTANNVLNYLYKYQNLEDKFNDGFFDLLISGSEIYWTGVINDIPTCRKVDVRLFDYDKSPEVKYIEDAEWAREWRWMTIGQVIDEFYDQLTPEDIKKLEEYKGTLRAHHSNTVGVPVMYSTDINSNIGGSPHYQSSSIVKVVRLEWKSRRKVGFLQYYDRTGALLERMVDEEFKFDKKDPSLVSIDWKWINEVWEATSIADDEIFVNVRPKPHQHRSLDNPSVCKLGYTGIIIKNPLVSRMKQIQYMYDIIMYRLELAFARAKGQTLIIDTASIPRSYGFDVERVLHHIDTSGVLFINSMEESRGGSKTGQSPTFNQFTTMDVGPSRTISAYVEFLAKLEQLMSMVSGVSPQREGSISASESVGGVERSVTQSSFITEPFFYIHNRVKWRVLTQLLEESQVVWGEGKQLQYYLDDLRRIIINITGSEYQLAEFALFVSDSTKDNAIFEGIRSMAEPMLQTGNLKLSDYIAIMETNSVSEAKHIMKAADEVARLQQQEQLAMQQEMQQQQLQAQAEQAEIQRQHEMALNEQDNTTKLKIAGMGALVGAARDMDSNDNRVNDDIEQRRIDLEREKMLTETRLKEKELAQDNSLTLKELEIKRIQANKPKPTN